jgi:hypothetical protein
MKKIALSLVAVMATLSGHAQESYNFEVGGEYSTLSDDDKTDQKATALSGTYYFKPIKFDSNQPYGELAFLQRASNVTLSQASIKYEDSTFTSTTINALQLSGRAYIGDWIIQGGNSSYNNDFHLKSASTRYYGIKSDTTVIGVGYFVSKNTAVGFENSKEKATYSPSAGLAAVKDLNITKNFIRSHSLIPLAGSEFVALDLAYGQIKNEQTSIKNNNEYSANAKYYTNPRMYFEGGYQINNGDDATEAGKTVAVGFGYALAKNMAIALRNEKFNVRDGAQKTSSNATEIKFNYRF